MEKEEERRKSNEERAMKKEKRTKRKEERARRNMLMAFNFLSWLSAVRFQNYNS